MWGGGGGARWLAVAHALRRHMYSNEAVKANQDIMNKLKS